MSEESFLRYPLADTLPAPGTALEIAPGIRWLRMPLPFALNHINLWLLRDQDEEGREGWAIVDCGISDDDTRAAWTQVFTNELQGLPVLRVIVTHMHPDHIGLAHWLTEQWNCRLWISATDWNTARLGSLSVTGVGGESAAAFFASHGLIDPESLGKIRARGSYYSTMVPAVPSQYRRLIDGLQLETGDHSWRCIVGYGHAPEHIALYCPDMAGQGDDGQVASGILISGDMLLPRISTNISVMASTPLADPLGLFLASIDEYLALPTDTLVLPSHGRPFRGLHARVEQLHAHHAQRCALLLDACRGTPKSAAELIPVLFDREIPDPHQTMFAMGESIAHLNYLEHAGKLQRIEEAGLIRFVSQP